MRFLRYFPYRNFVRFYSTEDYRKTTAIFMNEAIGAPLMINSYSSYGFTLNNGMKTIGSLAIFPRSVLGWNVRDAESITEESLALFYLLEPKIDMLVIGIGDKESKLDRAKLSVCLRNKGLGVEILPTEQACSTYNFMATEGRFVAGALIPPQEYAAKYHELYALQKQEKPALQKSVKNIIENMIVPQNKKSE